MIDTQNDSNSTFDPPSQNDDNTTTTTGSDPSLKLLEDVAIFIGKLLLGAAAAFAVIFCFGCAYLYYIEHSKDSPTTSADSIPTPESSSITELVGPELSQMEAGPSLPE